ncbi:MAG: hypothetical protein A2X64_09980 [Ignavibacteria bacterium GWF2_33_9]|nr:MAG: hypothetical protein A2X64_09980 [Ignavibacteria bacterium GWF2_33_9]
MEHTELLKKIRKIEIKTRGLTRNIFAGEYQSAFKGSGMAFSEVREYQAGDDIRLIDWNVTARLNHPYIKIFQEERELTVILMIDVSGSQNFGTQTQFKKEMITEIAALLSFSAIMNNDKIGVVFFSDKIEKFIPPKKGRTHILRIIRELLEFKPEHTETNISQAFQFITNAIKKKSILFLFSDFLTDENYEKSLSIVSKKHDTILFSISDKFEQNIPDIGLIEVYDPETHATSLVDTSSFDFRSKYTNWWSETRKFLQITTSKLSVDLVSLSTGESYIIPIQKFFKMREWRRQA